MRYEILKKENSIVSCVFENNVNIIPELYSTLNHNGIYVVPASRDLTESNTINYDVLGSVTLIDEMSENTYNRTEFYDFLVKMLETAEKIIALGVDEKQIVFDYSNIYLSMYDKSVRFICLPVDSGDIDTQNTMATLLKRMALNVQSDGAYELVGFIIEKTAHEEFTISGFKNELIATFGSGAPMKAAPVKEPEVPEFNIPEPSYAGNPVPDIPSFEQFADNFNDIPIAAVDMNHEYIPEGMAGAYMPNNAAADPVYDQDRRTQVLFNNNNNAFGYGGDIPYLTPIDNTTEGARVYISGERLTIGRAPSNDMRIDEVTVSGRHAEIHRSDLGCSVIDLGSTNRTYVNDRVISPHVPVMLKHMDVIKFNKFCYRFFER